MVLAGSVALGVLVAALLWLWWASSGSLPGPGRRPLPVQRLASAEATTAPESLVVVSWNIAWAFGDGSEMRPGIAEKSEAAMEAALSSIAATLRGLAPDLVLLQEVDLGAHRSYGVNQAAWLAERVGLPYRVEGLSWDVRWLPFLPLRHAGRLRSGGAILSRFPLESAEIELLPKPQSYSWVYRRFYLYRYILRAELRLGAAALPVYTVHLEAFDPVNRGAQAEHLAEVLAAAPDPQLILAGDLNSIPPEAPLDHAYPDEPHTDHRGERVISRLREVPGLQPAFPPSLLRERPDAHLSFPAHAPSRLLDHAFVGHAWEVVDARVVREAGTPSDHLPIVFRLRRADATKVKAGPAA